MRNEESGWDIFPAKLQEMVLALARQENYSIEYTMASLIAASSTAIGNAVTFADCETLPQNCRRLSRVAKRCRKTAGDFRGLRNVAAKLQETFRTPETVSQNCRRLSGLRKPCRKTAGGFPGSGNRVAKLQEAFRTPETAPQNCRNIAENSSFFLHNSSLKI